MSRYDAPRPKKSDFIRQTLSGKWFDENSFKIAVARWQEGKDAHQAAERNSRSGIKTAGRVTGAIVSGAMTLTGAVGSPQQASADTQSNWVDSSAQNRNANNARSQRNATRHKGNRQGGSGKGR